MTTPPTEDRDWKKNVIKQMVDRFLGWKLPEDFSPDAGITFKREFNENTEHPMKNEPVGTNLLNALQAEAMVRHILGDLLEQEIDEIRYDIEDYFDNAERRGDKCTLKDGRWLADKIGDKASLLASKSHSLGEKAMLEKVKEIIGLKRESNGAYFSENPARPMAVVDIVCDEILRALTSN